jgi:hypothetical protein
VTTTVGEGICVIEPVFGERAELCQTWLTANAGEAAPGPPEAREPYVTVTFPPLLPKLKPETETVRSVMLTLPALALTYPGAVFDVDGALHPSGTAIVTIPFGIRTDALYVRVTVFPDVPPATVAGLAMSEPAVSALARRSRHPEVGRALAAGASRRRTAPASASTRSRAGRRKPTVCGRV